jgi:hypothetical protein
MADVTFQGRTHDLILQNLTSSPVTAVNLVCARDSRGIRRLTEGRLAVTPDRLAIGDLTYSQFDPSANLSYSQSDFSGGSLKPRYEGGPVSKYDRADGLDGRWESVLTLGALKVNFWFLARNLNAEDSTVDPWTDSGGTSARDTAVQRNGTASWRLNATASGDQMFIDLTNPTVYQSRAITFAAYIRSDGSNNARLSINDGVGTTNGSDVTSATFTYSSVTRTINGSATRVRLIFEANSSATYSLYLDDGYVSDAGAVVANGGADLGGRYYALFGRMVCRLDETNDKWDAVYIHATINGTAIVEYNGNIFVAFGNGDTAYIYGSGTSWTVSTLSGDSKYAHFWAVSRQTLWKARKDGGGDFHFIASSLNAINGGSWSSEYTIGSSDSSIGFLEGNDDTIYVGKDDGLFAYLRVYNDGGSADLFTNILPDHAHFNVAKSWHGWLYVATTRQSLLRIRSGVIEDISGILFSPRSLAGGGDVISMVADEVQLFLIIDGLVSTARWLASLRVVGDEIRLHMLEEFTSTSFDGADVLGINYDAGPNYLWSFGRITDTGASEERDVTLRWQLPVNGVSPALDQTPTLNLSGTLHLPSVDYGLPDQEKAFQSLTIHYENNLDAEHTIVIAFALDGSTSFTNVGTANGSGTSSTFYFNNITSPETNAVGRAIQVRITMATDDTVSPRLYAIVIRANYRPARVKTWACEVRVGSNIKVLNAAQDEPLTLSSADAVPTKANIITALELLEALEYPIVLTEDFDDDDVSTTHRVHINRATLRRIPTSEKDTHEEVWGFMLQDVQIA